MRFIALLREPPVRGVPRQASTRSGVADLNAGSFRIWLAQSGQCVDGNVRRRELLCWPILTASVLSDSDWRLL